MMGPLVGCANLAPDPGDAGVGGAGGVGPVVTLACRNNRTPDVSFLDWELKVNPTPEPIQGGGFFNALLEGSAVFDEGFLDAAQRRVPGGVKEANLVDINATVHVRKGAAVGEDVSLNDPSINYQCFIRRGACDRANDKPSVPGFRGNTDCEPENDLNPCGRFVDLPVSDDCSQGGECAALGKTGPGSQCSLNDFCITGDLRLELTPNSGEYTANPQGEVLFGWDDQGTGATVRESGVNEGAWLLPQAVFNEPVGPNGLRVSIADLGVALECTMGVDSQGPYGVDSRDPLSSPTPDSELIPFPIQPP
jgi:hypothetical protein